MCIVYILFIQLTVEIYFVISQQKGLNVFQSLLPNARNNILEEKGWIFFTYLWICWPGSTQIKQIVECNNISKYSALCYF